MLTNVKNPLKFARTKNFNPDIKITCDILVKCAIRIAKKTRSVVDISVIYCAIFEICSHTVDPAEMHSISENRRNLLYSLEYSGLGPGRKTLSRPPS